VDRPAPFRGRINSGGGGSQSTEVFRRRFGQSMLLSVRVGDESENRASGGSGTA